MGTFWKILGLGIAAAYGILATIVFATQWKDPKESRRDIIINATLSYFMVVALAVAAYL